MIDCRVTPRRDASLSRDSIIQVGKSTFTLFCNWLGRLIEDKSKKTKRGRFYPIRQINNADTLNPIQHLDLYMVKLDPYQAAGYKAVTDKIKATLPPQQSTKAGLGYAPLGNAIEPLNIIYP